MRTEPERPSTARISITVSEFHEIGRENGCSSADIELTDTGNGNVSQSGVNATIVVNGEAYLELVVHGREGDQYAYLPIGIGFKATTIRDASKQTAMRQREECGNSDPLGSAAFPMRTIASKGDTAQLTVLDANPEPGEFEFGLVIQRSDGALSVIDPKIRNRGILR